MTLKVCRECKSRPAHSLDTCPQCGSPLDKHGENFLWDYEVDNLIAVANVVEAVGMTRPKDTDGVAVWRKYGTQLAKVAGNPADELDINKMDKDALIELFG